MNRNLLILIFTILSGTIASAQDEPVRTQSIDEVLKSVSVRNPALASVMSETEAALLQLKGENLPEDPSVEYSSFYSGSHTGQAGSELVVSQGFDFPTLYSSRHKYNKAETSALNSASEAERRRILLEAKMVCLDIIMYRQIAGLLEMQDKIAGDLFEKFSERYETGDASALELNKVRMESMSVAADLAANRTALKDANNALKAMNGNTEIIFHSDFYPLAEEPASEEDALQEYMSTNAYISAAEYGAEAAKRQVSLSKQGWIPKIEIGYRRNTAIREAEHGFLIGGSVPLFSNQRKVAMAKARSVSAHSTLNEAKAKAESEARSFISGIADTREAMKAYDKDLMMETLKLLSEAVEGGEISVIDYFVEASGIYSRLKEYIILQNRYQRLVAQLYAGRL